MAFPPHLRALFTSPLAWLSCGALALRLRLPRSRKVDPSHVLIVSWDFPPADSTGVHVPASLARYAALAGWNVSVLCGPAPQEPSAGGRELAEAVPPSVAVHRVPAFLASPQHSRLHPSWAVPNIDGGYMDAVALAHTALRAFADRPPAVICASGPRFANFLAARWLADAFGAKLALHYRDEWTVNTPAFVQNTADDRAEEARCLARADLVAFVSAGKEALYRWAYPAIDPAKFMILPNGWEPFFHERARVGTHHLPEGAYTLTYTGRWHSSLQPLLDALAAIFDTQPALRAAWRLVVLGRQLPQNQLLLEDFTRRYPANLTVLAASSPTTAIEIQRESTALLLLNEHVYAGVVPLKTFDYLCSDRPVLVFGHSGGAAQIVQDLGAGLAVNAEGLGPALARLTDSVETWDTAERRAWCARASRAVLSNQMLDAFKALRALEAKAPVDPHPAKTAVSLP